MNRWFAVVALIVSLPAWADLYNCREAGHTVIRDTPCDGQVPRIPVGTPPAVPQSLPNVEYPHSTADASHPAAITRHGANTINGQVVGVADGDTLTILDANRQNFKVRILGIDAPEKRQDYGQRSKANMANLAYGKQVSADCRAVDRWGRRDCLVTVDGKDVGLEQVRVGLAWWYRQYSKNQTAQERANYERAEIEAKAQRLGLWADKNPIEPWNWRRGARLDE